MKKILILANNDIGLYNFRKELIQELLKKYVVYVSLPYGNRVEDLKKMGCKFIDTKIDRRGTNPIKDLGLLIKYNRIVKSLKPDIILTYTIKPNLYGGMIARKNRIQYIANITGLGTALEDSNLVSKLIVRLYKIALKECKCIFCQNRENLEYIKKMGIKNNNYKLIPGSGVNLLEYKFEEYPLENEKLRFLFIGRLMKQKGIDEFISTARAITKKYPNTEFNILGFCEKEYENKINEIGKEENINYYGVQKDVKPFLKDSICLIHPTYYPEGMSNVLLEACSMGRPAITTNRSGCREIVENEKTGYIVEEKNVQDLIDRVEKFINLPYKDKVLMGVNARKKVEKEFDRNIVIREYMNIIEK